MVNQKGKNIIEEISKENKIMILQEKYKNGSIKLDDISKEEKDELINLYKKQIETLKYNINMKKNEINGYKEQIIRAREKLKKKKIQGL